MSFFKSFLVFCAVIMGSGQVAFASSTSSGNSDSINVMFNPILPLLGINQIDLGFKVSPNWTLGPTMTTLNWDIFGLKIKGSRFGVGGRYFFNQALVDSWYMKADVGYSSIDVSAKDSSGVERKASSSAVAFDAGGGYHWFWDSFNLNLGLVVGGTGAGKVEVKDSTGKVVDSYSTISTGMEFLIGFKF